MPPHVPPSRPLARAFLPSRLAPATLAQVYERLWPGPSRPVPLPVPQPTPAPTPPRAARA